MALKEAFGFIPNAEALMALYKSYGENEHLVKSPFWDSVWLESDKREKEYFWKSHSSLEG